MNTEELMLQTVKDLRALAERHGIAGAGRMRKDQLIGALTPLMARPTVVKTVPLPEPAGVSSPTQSAGPVLMEQPTSHPNAGLPIPDSYGRNRLVLLVQDPQHIFVYWEVAPDHLAAISAIAYHGSTAVLVVHTLTGSEQREIDLRGGNYYLNVAPNTTFWAEIALRSRDGRLHILATSNQVSTPAAGPSGRTDATWMQVDESFHELLALAGLPGQIHDASSLARLKSRTFETHLLNSDEAAAFGLSSTELSRRAKDHLDEGMSSTRLSSTSLGQR